MRLFSNILCSQFVDQKMSGVDYNLALMVICSCNNLPICAAIQKQLLDAGEKLFEGCFEIKRSDSPKITAFRMLYTWD